MDLYAAEGLHDQSVSSIGNLSVAGFRAAQEHKYTRFRFYFCDVSSVETEISGLKQAAESTQPVSLIIYWYI